VSEFYENLTPEMLEKTPSDRDHERGICSDI